LKVVKIAALAALAVAVLAPLVSRSQQPGGGASPAPGISDLRFLQGLWTADVGGAHLEQYYSPALGGVVVGVFRRVATGAEPHFELALLREKPTGVELLLRRFGPGLQPAESGVPLTLRLVEATVDRFVFLGDSERRTFERRADTELATTAGGSDAPASTLWRRTARELPTRAASAGAGALDAFAFLAGHWQSPFGDGGEVHELRLAPAGDVLTGAMLRLQRGAPASLEFSSLERQSTGLRALTRQFGPDLQGGADLIEAELAGGARDKAAFRGTVGPYTYAQTLELTAPDRLRSRIEIFKEDGTTLRVIELDSTRVAEPVAR